MVSPKCRPAQGRQIDAHAGQAAAQIGAKAVRMHVRVNGPGGARDEATVYGGPITSETHLAVARHTREPGL